MSPTRLFQGGLVVIAAALAVYPVFGTGYGVRALLQLFMWIALAGSWNLISGLTGYVSFGHVAFFGIGAYTAAILITNAGWSWPLACIVAGVAACGLALLIGSMYPWSRAANPPTMPGPTAESRNA